MLYPLSYGGSGRSREYQPRTGRPEPPDLGR